MTQRITPYQVPTGIPSSITDQFCNQIVAMQRTIEARGPELCYPSPEELNMQSKIITNVIKINKFNATDYIANAFKQFIKFAGKADKELGKSIDEMYRQFLGMDADESTETGGTTVAQQAVVENIVAPVNTVPATSFQAAPAPAPAPQVTLADFDKHVDELTQYAKGSQNSKSMLNGRAVSKHWLEHNLIQYTLPESERRFIKEADFTNNYLQRHDTETKIERYLNAHKG